MIERRAIVYWFIDIIRPQAGGILNTVCGTVLLSQITIAHQSIGLGFSAVVRTNRHTDHMPLLLVSQ